MATIGASQHEEGSCCSGCCSGFGVSFSYLYVCVSAYFYRAPVMRGGGRGGGGRRH